MADLDILGIAQLGTKLSGALDLHAETCHQARTNGILKLVSLIHSTSSTLLKVHELSQQAPDAFTEVCIDDINGLAATCRVLFEGTLVLFTNRETHSEEDSQIGTMTQEQVESLLSSLAVKIYPGYKVWEWLGPRLKICHQELRQVKFELMLRFLLGSIAQFQLSTTTRSPGDWGSERAMRFSAENIAKRRVAYHKKYIEKRKDWTKKDDSSSSPMDSIEEKGSVVTNSSSVTMTPSSVQVRDLMDKNTNDAKDVRPSVNNESPVPTKPTPREKDNAIPISSGSTSYLDTPSRNWFQRLFSRNSFDQWTYEDIEAYTIHFVNGKRDVTKLPLEEKEIVSTLRKLASKRFWDSRPALMEQYTSLDRTIRQDVDEGISAAKRKSSREMTLVAMSARKKDSFTKIEKGGCSTTELPITLFFKLGASYAPIYIVDTNNEKWAVPYNSCYTVEMIRDLIPSLGRFSLYKPPGINNGNYTILADNNMTVTPEVWDSIRRPGIILRLNTLPFPPPSCGAPPVRGFMCPPPTSLKRTILRDIYQEMNDFLKLSHCWMPDEETMKHVGLENLLRLWTNAIDTEAQDSDDLSDSSCSSGSDFYD
ncbi:hypothetical protein FVEN_g910 [Fusarium venenatum]|uniref:Ubiquitin-like domain-containing protein n=1 Tax=Fusarium venenatum TaxID=56646 RepID=A0A2L2U3L1_9HYPO|nr:uncharacterized protein FVRRES_10677 [Fusarium venenatum]KAG8361542.1 hypothetical protein FVEN_g910 [Fusarium venenatum]KAH6967265.1 hypothetical protein EDB82DRAFT_542259 [Fusarium venenatum]CEI70600.1 unnamed protein product [Fusarium venenatum]